MAPPTLPRSNIHLGFFFFFFFPASNANRFWWKQCRLMNFFRLAQGRRYIHGYTGPPGHLQCPRCAVQRWAIKSIKPLKIRDCVWVQIPQGGSSFCWHTQIFNAQNRHRTRTLERDVLCDDETVKSDSKSCFFFFAKVCFYIFFQIVKYL